MAERKVDVGITSVGVYLPYNYLDRATIAAAWGTRGKDKRALANSDEDSITMAVEAGLDIFRYVQRGQIDSVLFASTTNPYLEKSQATLIGTALNLREGIATSDFGASMRCATSALRAAYGEVASGLSGQSIVVASDMRNGYPKSIQEQTFGDGAAAVAVGKDNVIATLDLFMSVQNEIVDTWRNDTDRYVRTAEGRFAYEEGYLRSLRDLLGVLDKKHDVRPDDFAKIVMATPGPNDHLKAARKLGIPPERIQDALVSEVGVLGAPQPLLLLIDAIEGAAAGDRILVLNYGNGADAVLLTVTEEKDRILRGSSTTKFLENRAAFTDYGRFLSFRGIVEAQPGEDYKIPASTAQSWRERDVYLRLHASRCRQCDTSVFPIQRICPTCHALDDFESVFKTDDTARVFTYSIDYLAGRSDDPVIVQSVVEDQAGTRMYLNMTDFDPDEIEVDMEVEFTFRRIHELADFHNYYWKIRPLRRKV